MSRQAAVASAQGFHYVTFNGASSYIDCGADAILTDLHVGDFTVDFWVNARTPKNAHDGIVMKGDETTGQGWAVVVTGTAFPITDVTVYAYVNYPTVGTIRTVQTVTRGTWHHFTISYNHSGDRKLYEAIDGAWCTYATQDASVGVAPSDAGYSLLLGATRITNVTEFLLGDISWIRISDGIRYPIGVNFTPPARCKPPDMDGATVELWAMDEGAGTVTAASVVVANAGAMTDCVWEGCS